ncbi:MAG: transglycosylase family protein [bacterium]|nr:transglycosylase family protein [bacterium]
MTTRQRWFRLGSLVVAIALVFGMVGSSAGGQAPDERDAVIARLRAQIAEQETQIAAQRAQITTHETQIAAQLTQLNDYRCRFDVDTHLVPNGCTNSAPTQPPTAADLPAGTIEQQWEQLRQCNASGNYQYSNPNGINHGVYEFRQSTWDRLARSHHSHLEGVKPSDAAPADQDRMAYLLYEELGWRPWPSCGASLPALLPGSTPTPTSTTDPATIPIPAGTTQAQWDHLINCESTGDYRAYNPAGPYLGAFQFNQPTWNGVASRHYPHLEGVDPRDASPADQHRMAYALWEERGWQPWPHCGAPFRSS